MPNVPGKRLSNNRGRIARTRPPMRDETSLSGQALEYDLQQILLTDDVKKLIKKETGTTPPGGVTDVNLTMPAGEYAVTKSVAAAVINFVVGWLSQNANKGLFGPVSGLDAAPSFRFMVNNDLPPRSRIQIITTPFGGTVTPDASLSSQFSLIATSNFTLNPPTGMIDGQKITIRITQDGTGGRVMTLDPAYRYSTFLDSSFVVLSTAANATDYLGVEYNADAGAFDIIAFVPGVA